MTTMQVHLILRDYAIIIWKVGGGGGVGGSKMSKIGPLTEAPTVLAVK